MADPYFFGYGSLVNQGTHAYPNLAPATLHGWRRAWVGTSQRGVVLLTALPDPDSRIQGVIAAVPSADWLALDARESGYSRVPTMGAVEHAIGEDTDIAVYTVLDGLRSDDGAPVILLSYLDVVVQGFLHVFGEAGVRAFFDTTHNWHTPILDDRDAPVYPRNQVLTAEEMAIVDRHLAQVSATVRKRAIEESLPDF